MTRSGYSIVLLICLVVFAGDRARSDDAALENAILNIQADIERGTRELNDLRETIVRERGPLAAELEELQKKVAGKRTELERVRMARQQNEKARSILIADVEALENQCRFIQTLFSEYARAMDTRAGTAESIWLKSRFEVLGKINSQEDFSDLADTIDRLLALSATWREHRFGGNVFEGVALDEGGVECKGRFAAFGPVTYFASEDGTLAGLAVTQFGSVLPSVFNRFEPETGNLIGKVVAGGEMVVPLDVTGGDAIKIEKAKDTFADLIRKGGVVIWPLLVLGVVASGLAIWKLIGLLRVKMRPDERIATIIQTVKEGHQNEAESLTDDLAFPMAGLMREAIRHADAPREHLEEILHEYVLGTLPKVESHLGTLAVLGGVAPLLGLLGTVTGMIHTFQLVTLFGSGDAKLLSGGISEALVTTEFGLAIAIPVLLVHSFLARRATGVITSLEQTAVTVVNDLKIRTGEFTSQ